MRDRFRQTVRALAQPRALEWVMLVYIVLPIPAREPVYQPRDRRRGRRPFTGRRNFPKAKRE